MSIFSLDFVDPSLEVNLRFLINIKERIGNKIKTNIEIIVQISLQLIRDNKNTINTGKINSADDKPNHVILKALPLVFSKYLATVVVAVWDISPWPLNLSKKIPIKSIGTYLMVEKKKQAKESRIITIKENLNTSISSIFFPTQTKAKLLNKVAEA